jgi:hypothetical protein
MPRNWLRPRFELAAAAGDNLFEIDVTVAGFAHPLRIFTGQPNAVLDGALWDRLRKSIIDQTIGVTARGLALAAGGAVQAGPSPAATSSFTIAPVDAPGKIVYWALADDMGTKVGSLKGFGIGEESVQNVLVPSQVANRAANETCIGCHAATPDGFGVGFQMGPQSYFDDLADIRSGTAGTLPTYVSPPALATMRALHGIPTFSAAHWTDGDRIVLLNDTGTLHWVEVSGGATGTLARTGDANRATPAFSHDREGGLRFHTDHAHRRPPRHRAGGHHLIPDANRAGGAATPLPGASDPSATEYYPAFLARRQARRLHAPRRRRLAYSNPPRDLRRPVQRRRRGKAVRLAANDAAACQTGPPARASPTTGPSGRHGRSWAATAAPTIGSPFPRSAPGRRTPSSTSPASLSTRRGRPGITRRSTSGTSPPPTATTPRPGTTSRSRPSSSTEARTSARNIRAARPQRRDRRRTPWEA